MRKAFRADLAAMRTLTAGASPMGKRRLSVDERGQLRQMLAEDAGFRATMVRKWGESRVAEFEAQT